MWYRKKPVVVEAIRWSGTNIEEVEHFCDDLFRVDRTGPGAKVYDVLHSSWVKVKTGQWIIRGVKGEFYPCDHEVMQETYDAVDEIEADILLDEIRGK